MFNNLNAIIYFKLTLHSQGYMRIHCMKVFMMCMFKFIPYTGECFLPQRKKIQGPKHDDTGLLSQVSGNLGKRFTNSTLAWIAEWLMRLSQNKK